MLLSECDLSNLNGEEGALRRVEIRDSRPVGFALVAGSIEELKVTNSSLALGSFASAKLRNVIFERVNLAEVSFMEAQLEAVAFVDCELAGTDFRGVKTKGCAIRGSTLDGVVGVECLHGVAMPWSDVLSSARALAAALGIIVEAN